MANEKWSAFPNVGTTTTGDIVVGLRTGANVQFTAPIGTVDAGTINDLAWYAASGTEISGLATANSATLVTNGTGVPSWQTLTSGHILVGTTAGAPASTAISSGLNIVVGLGSGAISVQTVAIPAFTNVLAGYSTTATAATTTTLTATSNYQQYFTGTTTQTVLLPVTGTLVLGQQYEIINNSSGVVTVQSSGANTIQAMAANTQLIVTCISTSGTTAASWNAEYSFQNGGGAVSSGTINDLAWYAASGTVVSGLATGNNGLLVTSSGGVPSIGNTIGADIVVHTLAIGLGKNSINTNTALGVLVLSEISTGNHNTGVGFQALSSVTDGTDNTGVGYNAVTGDGSNNTGIGASSLESASGSDNTAIGAASLSSLTTGIFNAAFGGFTGLALGGSTTLTTGNNNTLLGTASGVDDAGAIGTIAIGFEAVANSATGATAGDNGPGITIGSATAIVGFRGDGTIYSGGTGRGYWRPNLNGTHYLMPCFVDGTLTTNASMITDANGSPILSATMTDGQVIIGSSAGLPVAATLTQGTGITITNANNSITIAATGAGGETWTDKAVSFNAAVGNGYFITAAATATLPASPTIGQKIDFIVDTAGTFVIQANTGQTIRLGSAVSAAAGTATNHAQGDAISLVFSDSSTSWIANAAIGNSWSIV